MLLPSAILVLVVAGLHLYPAAASASTTPVGVLRVQHGDLLLSAPTGGAVNVSGSSLFANGVDVLATLQAQGQLIAKLTSQVEALSSALNTTTLALAALNVSCQFTMFSTNTAVGVEVSRATANEASLSVSLTNEQSRAQKVEASIALGASSSVTNATLVSVVSSAQALASLNVARETSRAVLIETSLSVSLALETSRASAVESSLAAGLNITAAAVASIATSLKPVNTTTTAGGSFVDPTGGMLQVWVSADNVVLDGSNKVSTWPDRSGKGNNMTQSNSANRPLWLAGANATGMNGRPAVRFANNPATSIGTLSSLVFSNFGSSYFYVARQLGTASYRILAGTTNWMLGWWQGKEDQAYFGTGFVTSTNPTATTNTIFYGAVLNGTWSRVYRNSNLIASTTSPTPNGATGLGFNVWPSEPSDCLVAELLAFNVSLTTAQRTYVESYLMARYNITA